MTRPALAATRATEVLDWFAAHPAGSFTLSELSRALDINLASALSVLRSLTDAGYLVRHPTRKTYEAGPSMLALGLAATARHRSLELLGREMQALAAELGTECVASVAVAGQIVVVATEGRPGLQSSDVRVGQRLPLVPPLGQVFLAWSGRDEVEAWLRRLEADRRRGARAHLEEALAVVRRRGWSANLDGETRGRIGSVMGRLAERPRDPALRRELVEAVADMGEDYELLAPRPRTRYNVSVLAAPVFGPQGEVSMAITLNGFSRITGRELVAHAERLLQTTRLLTKHGDGRFPDDVDDGGPNDAE